MTELQKDITAAFTLLCTRCWHAIDRGDLDVAFSYLRAADDMHTHAMLHNFVRTWMDDELTALQAALDDASPETGWEYVPGDGAPPF